MIPVINSDDEVTVAMVVVPATRAIILQWKDNMGVFGIVFRRF